MSMVISLLFVFLFEQIIALMYFNANFELKRKNRILLLCFLISFGVQFFFHSPFKTEYNLIINSVTFFVANLFVLYTCYKVKLIQAIFNVILLEGIMATTEFVVFYFAPSVINVDLTAYQNNDTLLFIETAGAKIFYFFAVMLVSKIKNKSNKSVSNDFAMVLLVLPLISTFIVIVFGKVISNISVDETTYLLFSIITIALLAANLIVFFIHEKIVSLLTQNTEFQLEKQKVKISEEYYQELEHQYNKSNILVHDIKRQLNTIKQIAEEEKSEKVSEYISSINDGYEIQSIKRYTTNKLLNVIVTRYSNICNENKLNLFTDIRDVDISFVADSDLTAIVDNLLENSVEAAVKSTDKNIVFNVYSKNENFIVLQISNSCDISPVINNDTVKSSKKDNGVHGFGLRSVKRAVGKYKGNINYEYKSDEKMFYVTIVFTK